jgi:WD40 repeat protein
MRIRFIALQCFWILLLFTACGPLSPQQTITPTINVSTSTPVPNNPTLFSTNTVTQTPTPLPTFTLPPHSLLPSSTPPPTITQTSTNFPSIYVWMTQYALATPIRTPVTPIPFRLHKVYEKDGNLFFQKNETQAIQLTNSGRDRNPILSEDGQKIVFYRGEADDNVYSIDIDGTNEQLIIKSNELSIPEPGEVKGLTFIADSHLLLFNIYLCNPHPPGPHYNAPDCTVGLYEVNTDSGETHELVSGLSGNTMQYRNFSVSPDGKYVSVAASGHIDIYSGDEIIYQNALVYEITKPDEYLPQQYWLPDSSGLIAVVATGGYNEPGTPPSGFALYRYIVGARAAKIELGVSIGRGVGGVSLSISPDRNWVYFLRSLGETYVANLKTGYTQPYEGIGRLDALQWSPDSKYFASSSSSFDMIGSVHGPPIPVGGYFLQWIDSSHYYYVVVEGNDPSKFKNYIGIVPP